MKVGDTYLEAVIERFGQVKSLGDRTFAQFKEDDIHWSLHDEANSAAIIVKHMNGNMRSRWTDFLISDGEKPDRNRDQEFMYEYISKQEMLRLWEQGWEVLFEALSHLEEKDLMKSILIRGESQLVIEAIERQMAHYAYHVGQLVYIGKLIKKDSWKSLSIPKGQSEDYRKEMLDKHQ